MAPTSGTMFRCTRVVALMTLCGLGVSPAARTPSVHALFTVERPTVAAMIYAVSGILGTVLIAGGVFLLHRKDAHAFFTR